VPAGRVVAPGGARIVEDALAQLRELREQRLDDAAGLGRRDPGARRAGLAEACRQLEG
jgi:hypothetical protein